MCIGLGLKSGLFPFHFWMPDTYGYATPASSSLLSGVISKGYIVLLMKILWRVLGEGTGAVVSARHILLILGLGGILFGSLSAIAQKRVDRMLAYSSAAQIGYIYVGIGLGGVLGFTAAVYHILVHAFTKPALFLSAGRLKEAAGGAEFRILRGSGRRAPFAAVVFTAGSLSMVGIPFFAGFLSKLLIGRAALAHSPAVAVATLLVVALSSILNAVYFFHTVMTVYIPEDAPSSLRDSALLSLLSGKTGQRRKAAGSPGRECRGEKPCAASDGSFAFRKTERADRFLCFRRTFHGPEPSARRACVDPRAAHRAGDHGAVNGARIPTSDFPNLSKGVICFMLPLITAFLPFLFGAVLGFSPVKTVKSKKGLFSVTAALRAS